MSKSFKWFLSILGVVIGLPLAFGWWVDDFCRDCSLQVYVMMGIVTMLACGIAVAVIVSALGR